MQRLNEESFTLLPHSGQHAQPVVFQRAGAFRGGQPKPKPVHHAVGPGHGLQFRVVGHKLPPVIAIPERAGHRERLRAAQSHSLGVNVVVHAEEVSATGSAGLGGDEERERNILYL